MGSGPHLMAPNDAPGAKKIRVMELKVMLLVKN